VLLTSTARTSFNKISARLRYPRANTICIHSLSPVVSVFGCAEGEHDRTRGEDARPLMKATPICGVIGLKSHGLKSISRKSRGVAQVEPVVDLGRLYADVRS
jgi:hypothetical protein